MIFNRPWLVGALTEFMIVLVVVNGARVVSGIKLWDYLSELPLGVSPSYMVVTGSIWLVLSFIAGVWTWRGNRRAPWALRIVLAGYVLYYWIDQIFLRVSPLRTTNWPFMAGLTVFVLAFTFLSLLHPNVKDFYEVADE